MKSLAQELCGRSNYDDVWSQTFATRIRSEDNGR